MFNEGPYMRKIFLSLIVLSALVPAGCMNAGQVSQHGINQTTGVADIIAAASSESAAEAVIPETETTTRESITASTAAETDNVDIDLTILSSNMIYSQVFDMVYVPELYIGKTVKMEGSFSFFTDESTGKSYYACIVKDATQCCAQGLEFIPGDEYTYPDDFPEVGEDICVTGIFDTYKEENAQFITLKNASLTIPEEG